MCFGFGDVRFGFGDVRSPIPVESVKVVPSAVFVTCAVAVSSSPVVMVATRSWPAVIVAISLAAVVTVMKSVVAEINPLISPQDNESWRAALR